MDEAKVEEALTEWLDDDSEHAAAVFGARFSSDHPGYDMTEMAMGFYAGYVAASKQIETTAPEPGPSVDDLLLQEIASLREKLKIAVAAIKSYDPAFDDAEFTHRLGAVDYDQLMEELNESESIQPAPSEEGMREEEQVLAQTSGGGWKWTPKKDAEVAPGGGYWVQKTGHSAPSEHNHSELLEALLDELEGERYASGKDWPDIVRARTELAALRTQLAEWNRIKAIFREEAKYREHSRGQYWGHNHDKSGIWDSDNGPLAGHECAACAAARAALDGKEKS